MPLGKNRKKRRKFRITENDQKMIPKLLGNASLFTKVLFTIFVPLNPPPLPTSKVLEFLLKGPQTELRTLSQNCEQTLPKLRKKNRIVNKRAFLKYIFVHFRAFFPSLAGWVGEGDFCFLFSVIEGFSVWRFSGTCKAILIHLH